MNKLKKVFRSKQLLEMISNFHLRAAESDSEIGTLSTVRLLVIYAPESQGLIDMGHVSRTAACRIGLIIG